MAIVGGGAVGAALATMLRSKEVAVNLVVIGQPRYTLASTPEPLAIYGALLASTPRVEVADSSGLGSARPVLEAKSQILGVVAEASSEQVQPSDVLGIGPNADAHDDRVAVSKPE